MQVHDTTGSQRLVVAFGASTLELAVDSAANSSRDRLWIQAHAILVPLLDVRVKQRRQAPSNR